jgi:hypothetical protein
MVFNNIKHAIIIYVVMKVEGTYKVIGYSNWLPSADLPIKHLILLMLEIMNKNSHVHIHNVIASLVGWQGSDIHNSTYFWVFVTPCSMPGLCPPHTKKVFIAPFFPGPVSLLACAHTKPCCVNTVASVRPPNTISLHRHQRRHLAL